MKREHYKLYYNKGDLRLTRKIQWDKLNESKINPELIKDFPVNKVMKFDKGKMTKAIQYGMMILINYRGDKDKWRGGRERVICPLVMGRNKNTGNMLIRAWHFDGFSVSLKKNAKDVWRLFKTDNILSMMFIGDFFRTAPSGYKRNDRVMTEITYIAADFNVIRRNQQRLVQQGLIEDAEETKIEKDKINNVSVKNTETTLDLNSPWENDYFDKKNQENIKVSFLKSVVGNNRIAILGASGQKNQIVKLYENKKLIGSYKVIKSLPEPDVKLKLQNQFLRNRRIDGQVEWPLYTFVKKL
jgi:hypothetical protein